MPGYEWHRLLNLERQNENFTSIFILAKNNDRIQNFL